MNKALLWANGLLVGLMIVLGFLAVQSQALPLGAQSNFSGPLNSAAGYQESGTEVINTDGAWTSNVSSTNRARLGSLQVGSSTTGAATIQLVRCNTVSFNLGALAASVTSSVPFVLTGASTSTNQVYWFGVATSSDTFRDLVFRRAVVSTTANGVDAIVQNDRAATLAAGTSTYSLCLLEFISG